MKMARNKGSGGELKSFAHLTKRPPKLKGAWRMISPQQDRAALRCRSPPKTPSTLERDDSLASLLAQRMEQS